MFTFCFLRTFFKQLKNVHFFGLHVLFNLHGCCAYNLSTKEPMQTTQRPHLIPLEINADHLASPQQNQTYLKPIEPRCCDILVFDILVCAYMSQIHVCCCFFRGPTTPLICANCVLCRWPGFSLASCKCPLVR